MNFFSDFTKLEYFQNYYVLNFYDVVFPCHYKMLIYAHTKYNEPQYLVVKLNITHLDWKE